MSHVIDDTDILEHPASSSTYDESQSLPLELPPPRRGGFRWFAALRRMLPFARRQPGSRKQHGTPSMQKFELPIDILARQYPDIYIRTMSGTG